MARYYVKEGSDGGHCFSHSVMDSEDPEIYVIHDDEVIIYDCICECANEEDAAKICNALNTVDRVAENVARIMENGHNGS